MPHPSPFVAAWLPRVAAMLPRGARALDVAMGGGRHAALLAAAGFRVFGVDARFTAVRQAMNAAPVIGWCADLTMHPLPADTFDLVLVTRYLQRDLFQALRATVRPGGIVVYETFTTAQRQHGRGPTSPDHLLQPGELRASFEGFELMCYEEVDEPEAVARLVARRPSRANSSGGSVTAPGAAGPCSSP